MGGPTTVDSICRGELFLEQPRRGYRFNVDAVILASFAERALDHPAREVVDLGAGVGVVGLLLARRWPESHVTLLELQPRLAELAESNVARNGLEGRVSVRCADLRDLRSWPETSPDLVVSNPPFFKAGASRPSSDPERSIAKHETACALDELVTAVAARLEDGAAFGIIYPAHRTEELLLRLREHRIGPRLLRPVQPLPERAPARVLVLAVRGWTGPRTDAPVLLVSTRPGEYSREMQGILGDG
jgi:tRNA1Val (adenine37-N6)-methyltransferase